MELVVRKSDLLRELQLFQGIVERNTTIPVLGNILMEADGDELRFLATDLQVALRSRCAASVSKGGRLTLPAKKFFEIIRVLPETEVRIEQDKSGVKVAADRFDSRMQTMPAEDFPSLPHAKGEATLTLPAGLLGQMIARTQFATTSDDTRYFLNGVLLVASAGQFSLVATDGHRLSLVQAKRDGDGPAEEIRVILPKKTVAELGRLLLEVEGDIQYERQENHLFFTVGDRVLISRMIEAQFPAFERVVPKGNDKVVEFERERLANALKRVGLLSPERSRAVKFAIEEGKVEVSSSSPEFGEAKETILVDEYKGNPLQIGFNGQYVIQFLDVVGTDKVALELKDEVSQAVMRPVAQDGFEYTYVLMPMRF
jgi:DNA polymerase III subunit beta